MPRFPTSKPALVLPFDRCGLVRKRRDGSELPRAPTANDVDVGKITIVSRRHVRRDQTLAGKRAGQLHAETTLLEMRMCFEDSPGRFAHVGQSSPSPEVIHRLSAIKAGGIGTYD